MNGVEMMKDQRFSSRCAVVTYTNWKGETEERLIFPLQWYFGHNQWHPQGQWLVDVLEIVGSEVKMRTFAVKDIKNWRQYE